MENLIGTYTRVNGRHNNEDSCAVVQLKPVVNSDQNITILVLSDGMGGLEHGEYISNISVKNSVNFLMNELVVKNIIPDLNHQFTEFDKIDFKSLVHQAILKTNDAVLKFIESNKWKKTGATLVVVVVVGHQYYYGYLGDSRLYHWNAKEKHLHLITDDHNVPGIMVQQGLITHEVAKYHAQKNQLVYYMGVDKVPSISKVNFVGEGSLDKGDILFLCSDGINGNVDYKVMNDFFVAKFDVIERETLQMTIEELADIGKHNGEKDNQTVVFFKYLETKVNSTLEIMSISEVAEEGGKIIYSESELLGDKIDNELLGERDDESENEIEFDDVETSKEIGEDDTDESLKIEDDLEEGENVSNIKEEQAELLEKKNLEWNADFFRAKKLINTKSFKP